MITQPNRVRRHKYRQPHVAHTGDPKEMYPIDYCELMRNGMTPLEWSEVLGISETHARRLILAETVPNVELCNRIAAYLSKINSKDV